MFAVDWRLCKAKCKSHGFLMFSFSQPAGWWPNQWTQVCPKWGMLSPTGESSYSDGDFPKPSDVTWKSNPNILEAATLVVYDRSRPVTCLCVQIRVVEDTKGRFFILFCVVKLDVKQYVFFHMQTSLANFDGGTGVWRPLRTRTIRAILHFQWRALQNKAIRSEWHDNQTFAKKTCRYTDRCASERHGTEKRMGQLMNVKMFIESMEFRPHLQSAAMKSNVALLLTAACLTDDFCSLNEKQCGNLRCDTWKLFQRGGECREPH